MAAGIPGGTQSGSSAGPSVDRTGTPVVDPSENVKALTEAAIKRVDDLREADARYAKAQFRHLEDMATLRSAYDEKLRVAVEKLAQAESNRIDAIRAVDVGAVNRAAEVSSTQAATLAAQVATSAETLRTQVAAAATAASISLTAALVPIQEAIADLRRAQYEAQGVKANVVERRSSTGAVYAAIGLGVTLLLALITIAAYVATRK